MKDNNLSNSYVKPLVIGLTIGAIVGFGFAYYLYSNPFSVPLTPTNCVYTEKIISLEKAQELYDTYSVRRGNLISTFERTPTANYNPTRYGEYDYDMFQSYMSFLGCIDKQLKDNSDSIKSIRFYFGNYPDSTHFRNNTTITSSPVSGESYRKRNTFMIVPTSLIGGKDQGFLYKTTASGIEIDSFNTTQSGFESLILNEAGLRPPPPRGDDDFSF